MSLSIASCLVDFCLFMNDPGPCPPRLSRWWYNNTAGHCERFEYGGCGGNANRFGSRAECIHTCSCSAPSDSGGCFGLFYRYWFNRFTNRCEEFIYGGCYGNENNFKSEPECMRSCSR